MILSTLTSCSSDNKVVVDVSGIDVEVLINRYEVDFYKSNTGNLPLLKHKYPYLFPRSFSDSLAISKMSNKEEIDLFNETQKIYNDISDLELQLSSLFKHIKYYNPKFKSPNISTMISNIDYDSRVIYADSILLISLDVFLGKEHKFYSDYPKYIRENNTKENIIVDIANSISENQIPPIKSRSFIGKMVYEGKKMYLLDLYLPAISDKLKIGYLEPKLDWAVANEEDIWKYFIERKLLFSTDTKLNKRFLDNAPFSKFYLENDNQSPGRIGIWLGWQIVRSYMQNNDVSLQQLLKINDLDLYKKSKYKPRK
ncbi:MAG: gliding motility lipoprotein GldB [Polaribacter sp.]|nr:gliding motility lipoprotein GldB [Polaribacter sp.]